MTTNRWGLVRVREGQLYIGYLSSLYLLKQTTLKSRRYKLREDLSLTTGIVRLHGTWKEALHCGFSTHIHLGFRYINYLRFCVTFIFNYLRFHNSSQCSGITV
jgi:hypothetical protein